MDRLPSPPPRPRRQLHWRLALLVLLLAGSGCGYRAAWLDCSGTGEVTGQYSEINSGSLTFRHGLAWRDSSGGYNVVFTDDPLLAEAARVSPNPGYEITLAAEMVRALLVGFRFHPSGNYREHFTAGTSTSSGWSGADIGSIDIEDDNCARGYVMLDYNGDGAFAVPLVSPEQNAAVLAQSVELDTRTETQAPDTATAIPSPAEDALATWATVHAQLMHPDVSQALQALDFSPASAARLAQDARVLAALDRVRRQCPDPATAGLDEYGDVVGQSHPAPGIVLEGTALTAMDGDGPYLRLCYAMQRNGASIEQCLPFIEDCSGADGVPIER